MKQKIKLSTAIALGSQHSTQLFGVYRDKDGEAECALETADTFLHPLKRYGAPRKHRGGRAIAKQFGIKLEVLRCPACKDACAHGIASLVMHLNDSHKWTREHIADFLAKKGF